MDSVYRGWGGWLWLGWGMGWVVGAAGEPKAGSFIHLNRKAAIVCSLKSINSTCQADTVTDSSLTPSVALLVHPSGTVHSIVGCHEFTGSQK